MSMVIVNRPGKSLPTTQAMPKQGKAPRKIYRKGGIRYLQTYCEGGLFRICPTQARMSPLDVGYKEGDFDEAIGILRLEYTLDNESVKMARRMWDVWVPDMREKAAKETARKMREEIDRKRKMIVNRVRDYVNRCPDELLDDFDIELKSWLIELSK